ncbi:hypothetical protein D3C83_39900 [compost metagenome]
MLIPAMDLNSSPDRCVPDPLPPDAKLICPGLDFASATSSFTDFAGTAGLTIRTYGADATRVTGAKSFSVS